jgi:exosortase A-associated hydrolase 2
VQPFFLDGLDGPLFANFFAAPTGRTAYVFAPPFAEELNRSRHMMARLARRAADAGVSVLLLDLFGTGDSGGRFEDGSWPHWQDDLAAGAAWLKRQGYAKVGLVALRTGALLAAPFKDIQHLILWAPVISGEQFLTQFLRLKVAEAMARDAASKETTKDLKARLDAGETLEVGGYALTPAMAAELGAAKLADAAPRCPVDWIEVGSAPSPAAERAAAAWEKAGVAVTLSAVEGPMFWSLLEPEVADALIDVTVAAMSREAAR